MFAARALGIIGNSRATPALIEALKDRDVRVSGRAAEALGKIGDVLAVPGLIAVIESRLQKDWFNRKYAAVAMAAIGNSETLPLKVVACSYFSAQVRIEVLAKLRRLRYSKTYHDPSRNIRLRYIFPDTHQLCQLLIAEGDPVNREAAQTILNWLNGERQLLIPSLPAVSTPPVLLLRAVKGVPSVALVKQMLRPVDSSRHNVKPLKPRMRLRDRLFQKFSLPRCHNRSSSYRQSGK
jgi:hypothetical protein